MNPVTQTVTVIGAGIVGLWQALLLARAGHRVHLIEQSPETAPFGRSASRFAGAMLAPECEAEAAPALVRDLGRGSIAHWLTVLPTLVRRGSLVVAAVRDRAELKRFANVTERHQLIDGAELGALEPALADRFPSALYFASEAHMSAPAALSALLEAVRAAGVHITFGSDGTAETCSDITIDCRGGAGADQIASLRGVRGERAIVQARDVRLSRPVRMLHPRIPLYIVPWPDDVYMIGATVIESDDNGPMTVRSVLELLAAASAVHPGFAEASILELGAGIRPALPDNVPRALVDANGRTIRVNGAYRHGFLLAPVLAEAVVQLLEQGAAANHPLLLRP